MGSTCMSEAFNFPHADKIEPTAETIGSFVDNNSLSSIISEFSSSSSSSSSSKKSNSKASLDSSLDFSINSFSIVLGFSSLFMGVNLSLMGVDVSSSLLLFSILRLFLTVNWV